MFKQIRSLFSDENFLKFLEGVQVTVAKVLSLAMVVLILYGCSQLVMFLGYKLLLNQQILFKESLFEIFGLFLNFLIAIEILENISSYLKNHAIQMELVIITSLIAVARKIIIFEIDKRTGVDLIGLAVAIFTLSISYLIIKFVNESKHH